MKIILITYKTFPVLIINIVFMGYQTGRYLLKTSAFCLLLCDLHLKDCMYLVAVTVTSDEDHGAILPKA